MRSIQSRARVTSVQIAVERSDITARSMPQPNPVVV
jgi:hypothetical protein